jgi:uncharacterized membrane protein
MNARLSRQMTLLGICAMAFYGIMLGTGIFSVDIMPQFIISAVIFLSSGKIMRKAARCMVRDEEEEPATRPKRKEADWPWLTALLNWTAAFLIVGLMAIFLMKPIGVSLTDALQITTAPDQFFANSVP